MHIFPMPFTEIIALAALVGAVGLLIVLSAIDLKHGILPDKLVLAFLVTGLIFHYVTHFLFMSPLEILEGAALGGGLLYAVRIVSNFYYKDDVLGLGDVKLLAAAGAWHRPSWRFENLRGAPPPPPTHPPETRASCASPAARA